MNIVHQPPKALLLLRLTVENASIISSHLTYGMPSPTAFVGFGHALQRKLNATAAYQSLQIVGVGVACHAFYPQITQTNTYTPYQLNLTRHPVESDGGSAALLEEGKGHFEVTLIFGLAGPAIEQLMQNNDASSQKNEFINAFKHLAWQMRLAGGSVFPCAETPHLIAWDSNKEAAQKRGRRLYSRLLPSFILRDRSEILPTHQAWLAEQPHYMATQVSTPTLLDALLDLSRINWQADSPRPSTQDDENTTSSDVETKTETINWQVRQRAAHQKGWLVPLPVGYGALTPLQAAGTVTGARDDTSPVVFAKTLLGVGEWLSPHRVNDLAELLWAYDAQQAQGVYRVIQPFRTDVQNFKPVAVACIASTDATLNREEEF